MITIKFCPLSMSAIEKFYCIYLVIGFEVPDVWITGYAIISSLFTVYAIISSLFTVYAIISSLYSNCFSRYSYFHYALVGLLLLLI